MKEWFITVAPPSTVVAVSHTPRATGSPIGWNTYRVEAESRHEAGQIARTRFQNGDPDETAATGSWRDNQPRPV
jgi:hypothetical protein